MKIIFKGSTIVIITFALVLSCNDDFLDVQPKAALSISQITDQKGLEALLVAAYSMLDAVGEAIPASGVDAYKTGASNWVYGGITGGDAHKGTDEGDQPNINPIERYEASSVNNYFNIKWGVTYEGVNRCNSVLKVLAPGKGSSRRSLDPNCR